MFFQGHTIEESYQKMIEVHEPYVDQYYLEDYLMASQLRKNRDCLINLGDGNLTLSFF